MVLLKIYLDNCCYNRPYDDQSQIRISLETQAKLYIQNLVKDKQIELTKMEKTSLERGNKLLLNLWRRMNHIMLVLKEIQMLLR